MTSYQIIQRIDATTDLIAIELRKMAENLIGKSSSLLHLKEILVTDQLVPMTFYPHRDQQEIMILLTQSVINHKIEYIFQLSHEVMHTLLANKEKANQFEEGLCTYFSLNVIKPLCRDEAYNHYLKVVLNGKYRAAYIHIDQLFKHDSEFVKKLRMIKPFINHINVSDLASLPIFDDDEKIFLVSKF